MVWKTKLEKCLLPISSRSIQTSVEPVGAVLVPISLNSDTGKEEILLTKRTELVQTHKGQVSFPGGISEPEDKDLLVTALREAEEEVGLRREHVAVLGALESVRTKGALPVYPWVGYFPFPYPYQLNRIEVDRLLFLSLDRLVSEGFQECKIEFDEWTYQSIGVMVDGELVWGATAKILNQLRDRLLSLRQS